MNFLRAIAYSLLLKEKHDAEKSDTCTQHGWPNCTICKIATAEAKEARPFGDNQFMQSLRERAAYNEAARSYIRKRAASPGGAISEGNKQAG